MLYSKISSLDSHHRFRETLPEKKSFFLKIIEILTYPLCRIKKVFFFFFFNAFESPLIA